MSDRRAVSAGHFGASSVAAANDAWRVAVGGNRVENMTVEQIAHAFHNGQLNARTPLWPPGSTGWQALGSFAEFQTHPAAYAGSAGLAQFEEADDDPTRMWTGGNDLDLAGMEAAMQMQAQQARPSARTGTRQVAAPQPPVPSQPYPSQPYASQPYASQPSQAGYGMPVAAMPAPARVAAVPSRPAPTASVGSHAPALVPSTPPPFKSRGNGLLLVAGLVGLVGLGSAVLAARGSWGSAAQPANTEVAVASEAPAAETSSTASAPSVPEASAKPAAGEAQLAKYEDTSAFVAGGAAKPAAPDEVADSAKADEAKGDEPKAEAAAVTTNADAPEASDDDEPEKADKPEKTVRSSARARRTESAPKKRSSRTQKRAALAPAPRRKPAPRVEKAEKVEKAEASESRQATSSAAVNEAAAAALGNSANLASSCRPRGGPSGQGKARVIYSNDGNVQSVEILTAKFRDTLTGSCVRMVFRRAKIPAFKGDPPTFIKSFTIPEE